MDGAARRSVSRHKRIYGDYGRGISCGGREGPANVCAMASAERLSRPKAHSTLLRGCKSGLLRSRADHKERWATLRNAAKSSWHAKILTVSSTFLLLGLAVSSANAADRITPSVSVIRGPVNSVVLTKDGK